MRRSIVTLAMVVVVSLFVASGTAKGDVIRFTGEDDVATRTTFFYASPYIQGSQFSGTSPAFTAADVMLDSDAQTILYNSLTFSTDAPTTRSTSISEIRPGTFDMVDTQATITFDPISVTAENVGPLPLLNLTTRFWVQDNTNGDYGGFPAISLTGTYIVTRGTDTVSGDFDITMPIGPSRQFPIDVLYVDGYPNSIELEGLNNWSGAAEWNYPPGTLGESIFSGVVGGFGCNLDLSNVYFSRHNNYTTLTAVPEPSTPALLAILAALGIVSGWWRRR